MRANDYGTITDMSKIFDKGRTSGRIVFTVDPKKQQYLTLPTEGTATVLGTDHPDNRNIYGFDITTTTGSNLFHTTLGYMRDAGVKGKEKFEPIRTAQPCHVVNTSKSTTSGITTHHLAGPGVTTSHHDVIPTADQLRFAALNEKGDATHAIARIFSSSTQSARDQPTLTGVKRLDADNVLITSDPLYTVAKRAAENRGYLAGVYAGRTPQTVGLHTGFKVTKAECSQLEGEYKTFANLYHPHAGLPLALQIVPFHSGTTPTCPSVIEVNMHRHPFGVGGYKVGDHVGMHQ